MSNIFLQVSGDSSVEFMQVSRKFLHVDMITTHSPMALEKRADSEVEVGCGQECNLIMQSRALAESIVEVEVEPQRLLFAYGSLLDVTIQDVLLGGAQRKPPAATMSHEAGFVRAWTLNPAGAPSLGIFPHSPGSDVNGVMFDLTEDQFQSFQTYELPYYEIIELPGRFFSGVQSSSTILVYRPTFAYTPIDIRKHLPDKYVSAVLDGFRRYGREYVRSFLTQTASSLTDPLSGTSSL
jgi:hypothetical protein